MGEHDLLTIPEVASYLRVTERTVREMIKRGELKAAKVGKVYRIKNDDVQSLIKVQTDIEVKE